MPASTRVSLATAMLIVFGSASLAPAAGAEHDEETTSPNQAVTTSLSETAASPEVPASPAVSAAPASTDCRPGSRLNIRELRAVTEPWMDALWSFYSTGDFDDLTSLSTPRGIEQLRAHDWRVRAVERDGVRFREVPEILDFNDWDEWCVDRNQVVRLDVEPVISIRSGARTFDERRKPIEAVQGDQLRPIAIGFIRAPDSDDWLFDDVRPSEFRPRFVQPRPARPCPGLRTPNSAVAAFLVEPWCAAGGDGRRIPTRRPAVELRMSRYACLAGAHEITLGLPPGTPMEFGNVRSYLRDPEGKVRGPLARKGFRRDFRPPRDAISSGITNGYATIWTSETLGDRWLLVQVGDRFERWPQSIGGCGPA